MASSLLSQISEDFLKCQICHDTFKRPKVLSCLHTFCLTCLQSYLKKNPRVSIKTFLCPLCRQETATPATGADGLKDNFFVSNLLEALSTLKTFKVKGFVACGSCGRSASSRCMECEDFLCVHCHGVHAKLRATRVHTVLSIRELSSEGGSAQIRAYTKATLCPVHEGETMRFYCETCHKPICRDCTVLDHSKPDHKYVYFKDALASRKDEIQGLLNSCRGMVEGLEASKERLETEETELRDTKEGTLKHIEEWVAMLLLDTQKKKEELKDQVETIYNEQLKELSAAKSRVEMTLNDIQSGCSFSEKVLDIGTDFEILSMRNEMSARLSDLTKMEGPKVDKNRSGLIKFRPYGGIGELVRLGVGELDSCTVGELVLKFGDWGPQQGQFKHPGGVGVSSAGHIVVADTGNHRVQVFDSRGVFLRAFGFYGSTDDAFSHPHDVAMTTDDRILVTDKGNKVVKLFTIEGKLIGKIGSGHLKEPTGVAVYKHGGVAVTDTSAVKTFTRTGVLSATCTSDDPGYSHYLCTDDDARVYVSDFTDGFIKVLDQRRSLTSQWTAGWQEFRGEGWVFRQKRLLGPAGVCLDRARRNLIVADYHGNSVEVLDVAGVYKATVANGLNHPEGVAVTPQGHVVVVDSGNNCIRVYKCTD
ncbi:PREDICTED: tripartite motif-containing protein 3-like [Branchiostoma belcheri]|uniref:RING-type E3 ubiquitin transferase n=1 Tax=Branchiostoma belcheri TaxID=7741 RepID=A0A6P5AT63_BRABE|nr:PREDICTED: tripartite motif-containing protein 3-like [Branchiostoma belcheri]